MFVDKKYLIFDLDGTLIESNRESEAVVFSHILRIPGINRELAEKIYHSTFGTPLLTQLELIFHGMNVDIQKLCDAIYADIYELDCIFFPRVPEKIRELSKRYTLFLTTGNSTPTALKYLKKGKIEDSFAVILGSDTLLKGPVHLEAFRTHTGDPQFYECAVYIGDGDSDRRFAMEKGIDFIHIGKEGRDRYEISTVSLLDTETLIKE